MPRSYGRAEATVSGSEFHEHPSPEHKGNRDTDENPC